MSERLRRTILTDIPLLTTAAEYFFKATQALPLLRHLYALFQIWTHPVSCCCCCCCCSLLSAGWRPSCTRRMHLTVSHGKTSSRLDQSCSRRLWL